MRRRVWRWGAAAMLAFGAAFALGVISRTQTQLKRADGPPGSLQTYFEAPHPRARTKGLASRAKVPVPALKPAADTSPPLLQADTPAPPTPQDPPAQPQPRARRARIDPNAFQGERVELRLFDDITLTAKRRRVDGRSRHRYVWVGEIEGVPGGCVTLARNGEALCGDIRSGARSWRIRYAGEGLHEIRELGPDEIPWRCAGDIAMKPPPRRKGPGSGAQHMDGSMDDGSAIDILVVYTAAARAGAGGVSAIEAQIDAAISESNTALENSLIDTRFRLVGTAEVSYVESGNSLTDLERLQAPSDGFLDAVHGMRNAAGADVVSLIVEAMEYPVAGIAYRLDTLQTWTESWAFSVVRRDAASGGFVLTHEVGHNLACTHDRPNAPSAPMYPYAYGYVPASNAFRTVMAYGAQPRAPHFSNPSVNYLGEPTGVADSEDNARCIRNTAYHVSNYRQTIVNGPPVLDAVGDKTIAEGSTLSFVLSATDPDGDPVTYSATGLPSGATLNPQTGWFSWTPGYTRNGVYNVTFRASDPFGGQDSETIQITVTDVNAPPVANAGPDANVDVSSTVFLNGSGSYDPDGLPLSYAWAQAAGPAAVTLSNPNSAVPSFVPTRAGTYVFELVVSDGVFFGGPDSVAITAAINVATLPVPQPLSPPDGSTLPNGPVDFACTNMGGVGVTEYEFHILHNPSGGWTTYTAIVSPTPSAAGVGLPGDRLYRWMTRGKTSGTWGNYSGMFSLDLTSGPLAAPAEATRNFSAAADASTGEGIFLWDPVAGATWYVLEVQKSRMVKKKKGFFSRLIAAITGGKSYTMKKVWVAVAVVELGETAVRRGLDGPGEYRARVTARNNFGAGPPTAWTIFSW